MKQTLLQVINQMTLIKAKEIQKQRLKTQQKHNKKQILNYLNMKEKTILNKLKTLLGMEVKLEQMKLADGITVIQADSFEPEMEVMIVTTDEQMIPLPVGEYELEDGRKLTVAVEGVIASVEMVEEVEEEVVVEEVPVEASNEPIAPTPTAKKVIETSTKEMHFSAVDFENLQTENNELKTKVAELEVKLSETQIKPITFNPETQNKTQIDLSKTDSKTRITNELNNLIK
jgi:hypothetical protein